MCTTHGCSCLVCCRFFRRVSSFSSALPSDSPHQRIVCATRNYLIERGPLMCPWAFATQSESHRRPHTDNRAARHGFWKVTLRIAKNGSGPIRGALPNVHAGKWREEHAWIQRCGQSPAHSHTHTQRRRTHRERTRARPSSHLAFGWSIGWLSAGEMTVVGGLDGFTSLCLKGKAFCPSSNV